MELNFKKEKSRIANLSDVELIARSRDPAISSTDRMLIEAEISRRGLDRKHIVATKPEAQPDLIKPRRGSKLFSLLVMVIIFGSILVGILDDMGIDLIEWLRNLFSGGG